MRERIRRLEGRGGGGDGGLPFGLVDIDAALPGGGLARGALHALAGERPAVSGFAAALAARLAGKEGRVLWCRAGGDLHGPGVAAFGLPPERLVVARARRPADLLWAMEEGLKSRALAAVLGEAESLPPVTARRLQLAAETGGTPALLLLARDQPLPAVTRWRVTAEPSLSALPGLGPPRWRLELLRCRGGGTGTWILEVSHGTAGGFALVAGLSDRPADPAVGSPAARHRLAG
ncbi:MAG: hypothetical protein H7841_05905 [Magnetospirillum sp. WYHS-4]